MANGEWRMEIGISACLPFLQRPDQMSHSASEYAALIERTCNRLSRYQTGSFAQDKMRLELLERPLGDAQELNKGPSALTAVSFRDIGGN